MSENELRNAFAQLTAGVKPAASAYQRLMRRKEREHRIRTTSWATAAIGAGLSLMMLPLTLAGGLAGPTPSPSYEPDYPSPNNSPASVGAMTPWVRKVIDTPARGDLVGDTAFVGELQQKVSHMGYAPMGGGSLKLMFAGDVGEFRIAIYARYTDTTQAGIFLTGRRGDSPESLVEVGRTAVGFRPLTPYMGWAFRKRVNGEALFGAVGLAPGDCTVTSGGQNFGSFITWTKTTVDRTVRVSCGGVLRYDGPLAGPSFVTGWNPLTEEGRQAAREGLIGQVPDHFSRMLLGTCQQTDDARLRYGGPVPQGAGNVYIAACFDVDGQQEIYTVAEEPNSTEFVSYPASGNALSSTVAVPAGGRLVVVTPPLAVRVEVHSKAGNVLASGPVEGGIASLPAGLDGSVRAFDAAGNEVGTRAEATLPTPTMLPSVAPRLENW